MTAHNSISSNAFNSASFVSNGVDPRTGQYTVTINLPEINGNNLGGPALPMGLSFSPINTRDSGFGTGWDLSLTQFNPVTRVLSLSTGETYRVNERGSEPQIAERKLDTFRFVEDGDGRYQVVHKNGQIEVLEKRGISGYVLALPVQIQSPEGHSLLLSYQSYGNFMRLHEVKQADGSPLLSLVFNDSSLNIRYLGGASDRTLATYILQWDGSRLKYVYLPTGDRARWSFDYQTIGDYTCLISLRSPQGAVETIEHSDRHSFPNSDKPGLPRVTKHVVDPGRAQPLTETRYTYSTHNFLGNGATGLIWSDNGLDNLYRVTEPYEYSSTQTRYKDNVAGRTIESTYNRYHLLTEQVTTNGNTRLINATEYHLDDSLSFDQQPPQCQLPRKILSRWTLVDDPTSLRDEVETMRFDSFGNKVEHVDASGIRQTWTYYSALGEPGCPPDPYGFCRQVKEHRRNPAKRATPPAAAKGRLRRAHRIPVKNKRPVYTYNDEPVLVARFSYKTHPPLTNGPLPTLVLDTSTTSAETKAGEQVLLRSTHEFYDCPDIPERHGKPHTTIKDQNGYLSTETHEYDYATRPGSLIHKEEIRHDMDGTASPSQECLALYTGLLTEQHTAEGRILRYDYDEMQRIVSEEVTSADARYPAVCRYSYSWPNAVGRFAEHRIVDAEGVESVEELDGLGRKIRELRQAVNDGADQAPLRLIYSAVYGHEMQLLEETEHDWLDEEQRSLTRHLEYDAWSQPCREIDANGIVTNTLVNPFELTVTEWQDGMARTVTRNNPFGKPESVHIFPADPAAGESWLSRERSFYDGYGQLRRNIATNGGHTLYDYDVLGRLSRQRLPDCTRIEHEYAEHSQSALVTELRMGQGHSARASILVGSQRFDGLERVTHRSEGPRTTQTRYIGNLDVVDECITPAQRTIRYEYDLSLGNEATATHADESCTFEYHPITAALLKAHSPHASLEYQYDRAGRLTLERSEVNGTTRNMSYRNSLQGRLLKQVEQIGATTLETTVKHDAQGRIAQTTEGQLHSDFEYNTRGLLCRTTTQDLETANTLVTEVEYDALGRETLRTQRLTASAEYRTALTWAPDGQLQRRELHIGELLALDESFVYDLRGRLTEHACSGPDRPTDAYANAIARQEFDFDGMDNLMYCATLFADHSVDEARHFYAHDDPCQLRSITHTHPDYPSEVLFSYDADGNLTTDANSRQLQYDRQGRLVQVNQADGTSLTRYRYDAHDHLLGVTRGSDAETLRFYQGNQVRSMVEADGVRTFSYASQVPVGQQRAGKPQETLLTLCGDNKSVLTELKGQGPIKRARYTSYGETCDELESALRFNGECCETDTGWYLLGKGYRVYDPQLRRLHSPDSASPFGPGGPNPYAYCQGNPIRFSDPTGHFIHPREDELRYKELVSGGAVMNAVKSFGIGMALSAAFSIALMPLTGGASLAAFASGMLIEMTELTARTSTTLARQKQGKTTNAPFFDYWDKATMVITGVMMGAGLARWASGKAANYGSKRFMKKELARTAGNRASIIDNWPRAAKHANPRRVPLPSFTEPAPRASITSLDKGGPSALLNDRDMPVFSVEGPQPGSASPVPTSSVMSQEPSPWPTSTGGGNNSAVSSNLQNAGIKEKNIRRRWSM